MAEERRKAARVVLKGAPADTGLSGRVPPKSRVVHRFGKKLSVAELPIAATSVDPLERLPRGLDASALELDSTERVALAALELTRSDRSSGPKRTAPTTARTGI